MTFVILSVILGGRRWIEINLFKPKVYLALWKAPGYSSKLPIVLSGNFFGVRALIPISRASLAISNSSRSCGQHSLSLSGYCHPALWLSTNFIHFSLISVHFLTFFIAISPGFKLRLKLSRVATCLGQPIPPFIRSSQ